MVSPQATAVRLQLKAWHIALAVVFLVGGSILFFYNPSQGGLYPRCMLKMTTGLDCPGCGGLRAAHQLLHGNVATAFGLNPLLVVLLPIGALAVVNYLLKEHRGRPLYSPRTSKYLLWSLLVVALAFTLLRNLPFAATSWMGS